ncbi:MAG: maltodextrin glucosidase [Chloroflexi bacterium]|nr:maltodextrin glucosidase [Chloroflexota bacterium]
MTWHNSIHHDGSLVSDLTPDFGATVTIRLRAAAAAPIESAYLRIEPDGEQAFRKLEKVSTDDSNQWWEVQLSIVEPRNRYRFLIIADGQGWFYSGIGLTPYDPNDSSDFQVLADYHPPSWLHQTVFYQIFPDRFANGDPSNDPQPGDFVYMGREPQTLAWEAPPPEDAHPSQTFFGGDLQGITQHLDYIKELGVNALYLNPIFSAYSNHRYDVIDFDNVDPILGGNEALIELRQALDERDMRYIMDVVPNHCGVMHPWFQKALEDADSEEASYFIFDEHPNKYVYWTIAPILPKLNYESPILRSRMRRVLAQWLEEPYRADGWRVDVGNMLGRHARTQLNAEIIREQRAAAKEAHPDAYYFGENFFDGTSQLQGDQWDATMNYSGFSAPLDDWMKDFSRWALGMKEGIFAAPTHTATMAAQWQARRSGIPWVIALQQFNLLGSHDTPRIRTLLEGNDALQKMAVVLLMTFPGVPCILYGDEIGLEDVAAGSGHTNSRACMVWEKERWNQDLLAFYRKLIALRRESAVLARGGFQVLATEPDTIAYQRVLGGQHIIVLGHRAEVAREAGPLPVAHGGIADGTRFTEFLSGVEATVSEGGLTLAEHPQGASLWIMKE